MVALMDVATQFFMHFRVIPTDADRVQADSIITLLKEAFLKFPMPRKGIVVSHSVWYSSLETALDEDTAAEGNILKEMEAEFGPMTWKTMGEREPKSEGGDSSTFKANY